MPRRHIVWTQIKTWKVLYRSDKGDEVIVYTITRPKRSRIFRVAGGRRKFKAVAASTTTREFIIMGKSAKEKKKKDNDEITDDELKELESLEDVDDEDETTEPDEDTDDDGDEDEAPKAKKAKKGKKGKKGEDEAPAKKRGGAAPGKSRAAANGKVGTAEIAAAGGCDARTLRMVLRKHEIEKDEETGRYEWDSMKDPTVKKILKLLKDGEADAVKQEGLQRLKDSKAKDAAGKTTDGKKDKKGKKKKDKK